MEFRMSVSASLGRALLLLAIACFGRQACAGTVTYIYTDPQGTPLAEADVNGNVTSTFDYRPYGSNYIGAGMAAAPNGPGYTGHVSDPDTALIYMQSRYYDSAIGRFLSIDPVSSWAGDPFKFARYVYASNNPILNIDPDGREDQPAVLDRRVLDVRTYYPPDKDIVHVAAKAIAADTLYVQGLATGNQAQKDTAIEAMRETITPGEGAEAVVGLMLTGGKESAGPVGESPESGMTMGSSGGPGAGKVFSNAVKDAVEAKADGNCVFCGVKTTREAGPTQRNTDHAIPKARGGNNTLENAQNTCRTCNQDKRTMTTQEYLDKRNGQ